MTSVFSWQNSVSLCPAFFFYFQTKFACYSRQLLTSYFSFQSPVMQRTSFLGVSSGRSCRSSQNCSASASSALMVRAQTWITVLLNCLPQKRTEVILSFFRLHPSTAFQTLFLTCVGYSISSKGFLPIVVDMMVS